MEAISNRNIQLYVQEHLAVTENLKRLCHHNATSNPNIKRKWSEVGANGTDIDNDGHDNGRGGHDDGRDGHGDGHDNDNEPARCDVPWSTAKKVILTSCDYPVVTLTARHYLQNSQGSTNYTCSITDIYGAPILDGACDLYIDDEFEAQTLNINGTCVFIGESLNFSTGQYPVYCKWSDGAYPAAIDSPSSTLNVVDFTTWVAPGEIACVIDPPDISSGATCRLFNLDDPANAPLRANINASGECVFSVPPNVNWMCELLIPGYGTVDSQETPSI